MAKPVLPVVTFLVGIAVGSVLSSASTKGTPRRPVEEPPAPAADRFEAERLPAEKLHPDDPEPIPAHRFRDLGHSYHLNVLGDGRVMVTRMR